MIARFVLAVSILLLSQFANAQRIGNALYPIKGIDGSPVANHGLSAGQMTSVAKLPGLVSVGNPKGDVTLYEFYDLNCPYCRQAAGDVDRLVQGDKALRMVLVPYPVLSAQSVEGARVELALREIAPLATFMDFHRKIYAGRGVIDGARALGVARKMGIDLKEIIEIANAPRVTETMKTHSRLGSELRLVATPSYIIQGVAILGHPGLESLRKVIRSVRACKKVVC